MSVGENVSCTARPIANYDWHRWVVSYVLHNRPDCVRATFDNYTHDWYAANVI